MEIHLDTMRKSEQIAFELRDIYEQYGYRKFRMAKFEEYDFYQANRDFVGSGQILAFTGINGKLMALKPDVTMSIVKNTRATLEAPEKAYYTESVYRASLEAGEFREITQIGVEFIGEVTLYTQSELVSLALKSLACLDKNYILDISHMGMLTGLLNELALPGGGKRAILSCVEKKNQHELAALIESFGINGACKPALLKLAALCGPLKSSLKELEPFVLNEQMREAFNELCALSSIFEDVSALRLDFSITGASHYYNGLMLRGYIASLPRALLVGGRYDPLLKRMGKPELQAMGYAIHFDEIERYLTPPVAFEYDAVVLYDEKTDPALTHKIVEALVSLGNRVYAGKTKPPRAERAKVYDASEKTLREVLP
ncbi:ATP phosphoribosyltransferase regulatory subunit [Eubacteriales bacterium OttesenSCG-928-K08]|nr:ATP phosphoribosyltransferase regulatory subunit [Eubacteriales bacterium OttesenSCG-928-K08]